MTKRSTILIGLLLTASAVQAKNASTAPSARLSLPAVGTYTYWIQEKNGVIPIAPVTVSGSRSIQTDKPVESGETLYILDSHSGAIATRVISVKTQGTPVQITLTNQDFKPLTVSSVPTTQPTPPETSAAPIEPPSSTTPAPPKQSGGDSVWRFLALLLGWVVAAAVIWFIIKLVRSRGTLLIDLARKAGVEVPDPNAAGSELPPPPIAPMPTHKRPIEKIPDSAGLAPPTPRAAPRPRNGQASGLDVPQLVGKQGLVAGTTFAIADGIVTVGRDGDNTIVLAESTVSRHHARLERHSDGSVTITDLGSGNGVVVNGERLDQARLSPGDEVKIGDNYFRYEE